MALSALSIRNFAIIDYTEVDFSQGLSVITGETGAGKSILLNALNLILGARADINMIRHGEPSCEVSASFNVNKQQTALNWLREHDFEEDEGECIIRRIVKRESGSKHYINGRPTTISMLRELGAMLVDLHSQHEHQSLLRKTTQYTLIDDLAQANEASHNADLKNIKQLHSEINQLKQQQTNATQNYSELSAAIDLLNFQAQELEEANVNNEEFAQLDAELKRLSHARELIEGFEQSLFDLSQNSEGNAESLVGKSLQKIEALKDYAEELKEPADLLNSALAHIQEAHHALQSAADKTELDPERLNWVEQRIDTLINLARKHRCAESELGTQLSDLSESLAEKKAANKSPEDFAESIDHLNKQYLTLASLVTQRRQSAAIKLSQQVTEQMQQLGMQGGSFCASIESLPTESYAANGKDKIEFQVSTNPGSPLQALSKTASGGELSRISLAIQVITSRSSQSPTLIFDEVDVGIGGGIAEVVGARLKELSSYAQVICITHLPQVAAQGDTHLLVHKSTNPDNGGGTSTDLVTLSPDDRTQEIARMLGGIDITATTLAHAQEMLQGAG